MAVRYFGLERLRLLPVTRESIRRWSAQMILIWSFTVATGASAASPGLEYRIKAQDGLEFKWGDGKSETLERQPFMVASDFGNAIAIKSTNPNARGAFEIDLVYNTPGKQKYRATAKADQTLEYCAIFNDVVLQCYTLTPDVIPLYSRGGTIYGPFSKTEAEVLTHQIKSTLRPTIPQAD